MTRLAPTAFTHDGEGRFLDQTGNFFHSASEAMKQTAETIGRLGTKALEVVVPFTANAAWTVTMFAYTGIANVTIAAGSAIGNAVAQGYAIYQNGKVEEDRRDHRRERTHDFHRIADTVETAGNRIGDAAINVSSTVNETGKSCQLLTKVIAFSVAVVAMTFFRNSVCATNRDSVFCAGPSKTTMLLTAVGLTALGAWLYKSTAVRKPEEADRSPEELQQMYDCWDRNLADTQKNLDSIRHFQES